MHLTEGRQVLIERAPDVSEQQMRVYLLGPALAVLLYQRGFLVLHSSAVALPDANGQLCAVAFLGNSGDGKSTLAATLHARGHAVIADDFIAVPPLTHNLSGAGDRVSEPIIAPGYPQLRLWPSSLEAIGEDADSLPSVHPGGEKRTRGIADGFCVGSLPLRRIYVLGVEDTIGSYALHPARGAISLTQHACCTGLLPHEEAAEHFKQCADMAQRVAVHQLHRPRDLNQLAQVAEFVEGDIAKTSAPVSDTATYS
jgi:hypothetical protein